MVCWNLRRATYGLEVDMTQILAKHETLSMAWHLITHVDYSIMIISLDLQAFTLSCEEDLDGLHLFDQGEMSERNGHGPSVSCVKWPLAQNW